MPNGDVDYDSIIEAQLLQLAKLDVISNDVNAFSTKYRDVLASAKEKEEWKSYSKAVADGLTGVTKGTISAVNAFKQTPIDPVAGSAAIMDICSGIASALSNIPGPVGGVGAVFGALFSMISSILNACAPKPPSLLDQIEKLMRDLDAEEKNSMIKAAGDAVFAFASTCDGYMALKNGKLQKKCAHKLAIEIPEINPLEGNTVNQIHLVQHWLEQPGNQDLKGWPEVLSLVCETYMHLWRSVMLVLAFAHDPEKKKAYIADPANQPESPQEPDPVADWNGMQDEIGNAIDNLKAHNVTLAGFVRNMVPVARKRGIFVHAQQGGSMFVTSGKDVFSKNLWTMFYLNCGGFSISIPREGVNRPGEKYDGWISDNYNGHLTNNKVDSREAKAASPSDSKDVGFIPQDTNWLDWAAIPSDANTFTIYVATDKPKWLATAKGGLQKYTWNMKDFNYISWEIHADHALSQVRIVSGPATLDEDPDNGDMPENVAKRGASILYGTLDGSNNIFVAFTDAVSDDQQWRVAIPYGTYSGIAVDPYFLWVYGKDGFACATHASVMRCIEKKRTAPRWLGNGNPATTGFNVRALASCPDGTLLLSTPDKLRAAAFHVDLAAAQGDGMGLIIDLWDPANDLSTTWKDVAGGEGAQQVHKLPIYGWPRIESLLDLVSNPDNQPAATQLRRQRLS
ncbi:MAG: hypothetical protein K2Z80_21150 [Xanthobacteraceae bacterium]|nr:hypothetical protein [Xanthobacteraceae bacterium]